MRDPRIPRHVPPDVVVAGLTRLSTVDWPGRLAAVVFCQGCPWRCTYCQNPGLIDPRRPGGMTWPDVLDFLDRRHGLLDGVVLSGGEPTLQQGLCAAVDQVRERGFAVGLHTAGPWPGRLERLLPRLDWVGLDIKHLPYAYGAVTRAARSGDAAWRSLAMVIDSGVDHEVRTTVDPTVHTRDDVLELVERLHDAGARRIVLQEARATGTAPGYAAALGGRRLADVLRDDDLPCVERRTAAGRDHR